MPEITKRRRRLIVNADDFGASTSVNHAVIAAHRDGILTSASLMVNGDAFDEAVELAKAHPKLGVGLHLTLCRGRTTLPAERIPALAAARPVQGAEFGDSPVAVGMKYFFSPVVHEQLRDEIGAQFEKFTGTGLQLDHVNGHLHFHLHPTVFGILGEQIETYRVRAVRLTRDPLWIDWRLGRGRWWYRLSHGLIFGWLSRRARGVLARKKVAHTRYVFGLLESERVSENYFLRLARVLPAGDSELYAHPSLLESRHEFDALVSPRVKWTLVEEGIELIKYQDLWRSS